MAKIAVMGAGIGGISQVYELREKLGKEHEVFLVHLAKIAYEKYFLHKVRKAKTEPYYEKAVMKMVGALRLKETV
ncbi:MAG: hypothetical protein WBM54_06995 [Woeseia sp.]